MSSFDTDKIYWSPAGRGNAITWADVMRHVERSVGRAGIEVRQAQGDPPLTIPPGTYDLGIGAEIVCPVNGDPTPNIITVQDGAILQNLTNIEGATGLNFLCTQPNAWVNTPSAPGQPPVYRVGQNASIINSGSAPIVEMGDLNEFLVLVLYGGSFLSTAGSPLVRIGQTPAANSQCLFAAFELTQPTQPFDPAMFTSPSAGTAIIFEHDGTPFFSQVAPFQYPIVFPGFPGIMFNAPFGQYGGAGSSNFRPIALGPAVSVGCMFYETDATVPHPKMPIFYDGTNWLDAAGAGPVPT